MATKFFATSAADTFTNPSHTVNLFYAGGTVAFEADGGAVQVSNVGPDSDDPYNGFVEGFAANDPRSTLLDFISAHGEGDYFFEIFDDNSVDYSFSTAAVSIDLTRTTQHGGFAEGDHLVDIFEVTGSIHNDVIRGSSTSDYPPDRTFTDSTGVVTFLVTLNKPFENVLNGGDGSDLLEGRGGADTLNGGSGFDFASYESSPSGVTVRLAGVGT